MIFYDCKETPPKFSLRYLVKLESGEFISAEYFHSSDTWYRDLKNYEVLNPLFYTYLPIKETMIISKNKNSFFDLLEMVIWALEKLGFWKSGFIFLLFLIILILIVRH